MHLVCHSLHFVVLRFTVPPFWDVQCWASHSCTIVDLHWLVQCWPSYSILNGNCTIDHPTHSWLDTYVEIGCAYLPLPLVVTATDVTMQRHTSKVFQFLCFPFPKVKLNYSTTHMRSPTCSITCTHLLETCFFELSYLVQSTLMIDPTGKKIYQRVFLIFSWGDQEGAGADSSSLGKFGYVLDHSLK